MNDDELEQAIAHLGLDLFGEDTKLQVEELLANGQTVEPKARQKLISAAQRALRLRAMNGAAFEILVFETRRDAGVDIDQLAEALAMDASNIRSVERGDTSLQELSPSMVATWIDKLDIDNDVALGSVEESLQPRRAQSAYAVANEDRALSAEAKDFVDSVRDELSRRSGTPLKARGADDGTPNAAP